MSAADNDGPFGGIDAVRARLADAMASAFGQAPSEGLDVGMMGGSIPNVDPSKGGLARAVADGTDPVLGNGFEAKTEKAAVAALDRISDRDRAVER